MKSKFAVAILLLAIIFPFAGMYIFLSGSTTSKGGGWISDRAALQAAAADEGCAFEIYLAPSVVSSLVGGNGERLETIGRANGPHEIIRLTQQVKYLGLPPSLKMEIPSAGAEKCSEYAARVALRNKYALIINQRE